MNKNCLKKDNKSKLFLQYTLIFLITVLLFYLYFFISGKTFISTADAWRQHYVAFVYFGQYVRKIMRNLFTLHKLVFPSWSFSIGYGGDILTTLNYYAIGDPLDLLSVVVPSEYASHAYDFLIVFRLYLAGLFFILFCRYKNKNLPVAAFLSGALVYVFSTWSAYSAVAHPFFANPMIYLPLLLLGVEKIIDGKRPYIFIITVFISAISNFYFFYMLVVFTVLYVILRLVYIYIREKDIKNTFINLFKIALCSVIGLLMSAVILIPVLATFFEDSRLSTSYDVNLFYIIDYYRSLPSVLVSAEYIDGYQTLIGASSVCLISVSMLFIKKKEHIQEKIAFVFLTLLLLTPVAAHIINGFSYVANRWTWAYMLLLAYIVSVTFEDVINASKKDLTKVGIVILIYSLLCLAVRKWGSLKDAQIAVVLCLALITVGLLLFIPAEKKARFNKSALITVMIVVTVVCSGNMYYAINTNFSHKFVNQKDVNADFYDTIGNQIKDLTNDKSFYRYSVNKDRLNYNRDLIFNTHSTSFYWSLQNPKISQFVKEMQLTPTYVYQYQNLDSRTALNSLLGVKYYQTEFYQKAPYGFTRIDENIYKNRNAMPLGYTYSSAFTRDEYDSLTALEKQSAITQGVMLEEKTDFVSKTDLEFDCISLPYEISTDNGIKIDGDNIYVSDTDAFATISFNGAERCEYYLKLKVDGFECTEEGAERAKSCNVTIYPYSGDNKHADSGMRILTEGDAKYDGRTDYLLSAGYSKDAIDSIKVRFEKEGIYKISEISVWCQPMKNFSSQVSELKQSKLENIKIGTDTVDGTISVDENKILCLSIPYSNGWSAYIDGEQVELLQANTMMSAVKITPGEHKVHLKYKTPYLNLGIAVSVCGAASLIGIAAVSEIKRKRVKK